MIYNMYAVQDVMVGFNAPFIMVNENVAKREYANFLKSQKCTNPTDMRLFKVGTFDDATGTIVGIVPEQFVGGGSEDGSL